MLLRHYYLAAKLLNTVKYVVAQISPNRPPTRWLPKTKPAIIFNSLHKFYFVSLVFCKMRNRVLPYQRCVTQLQAHIDIDVLSYVYFGFNFANTRFSFPSVCWLNRPRVFYCNWCDCSALYLLHLAYAPWNIIANGIVVRYFWRTFWTLTSTDFLYSYSRVCNKSIDLQYLYCNVSNVYRATRTTSRIGLTMQ